MRVVLEYIRFYRIQFAFAILSFGVISQKSEFFVKNRINKIFYFLKVNLYIYIYIYNLKLYLTRFYGSSYAVFVGAKIWSMLGFLVVVGGCLKKAVLSLLSYRVKILSKLALGVSD
ncbi:hypothetical protein HpBT091_06750 [Helicobacter pylori]